MNKELYVSSTPHETKVALVEDDQLAEVFYERENEYTLAGSIYKGRVTRVLPGMQSAFVDIGLERDAFLYVSDFLELGDEDDTEEFGQIPAPATTVNLSRQSHPSEELQTTSFESPADEQTQFVPAVEEPRQIEGARRWRGRRRRGGRRGGRDDRSQRNEPRAEVSDVSGEPSPVTEPANEVHPEQQPEPRFGSRSEPRPRPDFGPPPGYTPIVLPGESISKYRNLPQQPAAEEPEAAIGTAENNV